MSTMHRKTRLIALKMVELFKFEKAYTDLWDTRYSKYFFSAFCGLHPELSRTADHDYALVLPDSNTKTFNEGTDECGALRMSVFSATTKEETRELTNLIGQYREETLNESMFF